MNKPICTIYATCGYTRLVMKQTRHGLFYYVKCHDDAHWTRIAPSELLDYVPSVEDLDTCVWYYHRARRQWLYVEGLPVALEKVGK
jgi:hypothetical protein